MSSHQHVLDPVQEHLGAVYARGLMRAAQNARAEQKVLEELEDLTRGPLATTSRLRELLESPRVPDEAKTRMLDGVFQGDRTVHPVTLRFLKVLARRGRFDCLDAIARAARDWYRQQKGIVAVKVVAAQALDGPTTEHVKKRLEEILGKQVELEVETDPNLLGGIVFRIGDSVLDGSVVSRLAALRRHLASRTKTRIRESLDRFTVAT